MCKAIYAHYSPELAAQIGLDKEDCQAFEVDEPEKRWAEVGIKRPAQQGCLTGIPGCGPQTTSTMHNCMAVWRIRISGITSSLPHLKLLEALSHKQL